MAGQVMEAHHQGRLQAPAAMPPFAPLPPAGCKHDVHHLTAKTTAAAAMAVPGSNAAATVTAAAADMAAYLQQLQDAAAEASKQQSGGAARGEQCPRCASHDTKFCYYNNYNTSQPRHFCRACRRYWTLGGSLRNVPIGGSTRKRPRLAHHHHQPPAAARRAPLFGLGLGGQVPPLPSPAQAQAGGLLGSLFALGAAGPLLEGPAAPLLEGRGAGFDLGLGLPAGGPLGGGGEAAMQVQGLGLRGGGGGGPAGASSSGLFWPAGLLDNDTVDTWKMLPGAGVGAAMWPDFSAAAAAAHQTGGLLHGGAQLM
ncbi:dof zinc finger protein DOF1.6-like [Panicum virgatum]|uniref:Dof zinc finger protein n=1 Tax=Panicum virgatum TaxID=38727 RepID=A0A8T0MH04_PANVG|nr:dof zinc finger protein DOF1.6-like [Panicum virgatum]KAG2536600.1 hypothetical protein PVAP13_9NG683773 [Panicum virgatum]